MSIRSFLYNSTDYNIPLQIRTGKLCLFFENNSIAIHEQMASSNRPESGICIFLLSIKAFLNRLCFRKKKAIMVMNFTLTNYCFAVT